ncbi:MAG: pyridoxamine 5'-phosphate oxidase family protein [Candidatus Binatus sp.]|uniref:MSMEG_1061 family FMN-dependent PPOX-type flavoprotein n=1 Tax=Candidatus Binatus sp. TaxID=2811406 RepID=UPI0027279891|nr:MSMEG_1061 family FMN-dependent PPOX-type flavoprotein [Candidatus Binatus sp.]MDO8432291.1 pyridoxamine 5'-phosphate oxidase family protein [Candidatus Binatus sp.]
MENGNHRIETFEQLRSLIGEPHPLVQKKVFRALDQTAIGFIKRSPFIVLSTADAAGNQDSSPKGDGPGFVLVENERTLLIPERKGNKLMFGLGNILQNPRVGIIFLVPGANETLRVNGAAELTHDPSLLERMAARGGPALLAIRVTVDECFFHCAKAFLRSQLWKPETWPAREAISFGKMLAATVGGDDGMAAQIDKSIEHDYKTNL